MTKLERLVHTIRQGELLCLPTDTLYALSCDATNDLAVKKVFIVKSRDTNKSLPIFVYDISQAKEYGVFNDAALTLAYNFWPGPLTLVLPLKKNTNLSPHIYMNKDSIAIRVPKHHLMLDLLQAVKLPLVATSANISGQDNEFNIDNLRNKLKEYVNIFVEDRSLNFNVCKPSSIVDCTSGNISILRTGVINELDIKNTLLNG